ncbi:MAG: NADH-quinone oxidoreductase subunit J [Chloroflexota bacterium]
MDGFGVVSAFWVLSLVAVVSALGIIVSRNLLHAVLWLILTFVALAGLFITLTADFVAVAQVLVYAGAVGVLVVFAVMLTPNSARANAETRYVGPGLLVAAAFAALLAYVALRTDWPVAARDGFETTAQAIGALLVTRYVLAFEVASLVLIAAMVGAIVLVRAGRTVPEEQVEAVAEATPEPEQEARHEETTVARVP